MRPVHRITALVAIGLAATLALSACTKKNEDTAASSTAAASVRCRVLGRTGQRFRRQDQGRLRAETARRAVLRGDERRRQGSRRGSWATWNGCTRDRPRPTRPHRPTSSGPSSSRRSTPSSSRPNDPDSMAPLLQQAKDAGIHVATADTDAPTSVREAFVNQASVDGIGQGLTDALMTAMGGKGKYAIVSCGESAANLNAWIAVQKSYTASKYPDAEIVDTVYAGEDQAKATQMATDLMNAHPDLTGLVGECTSSAPGVAQAVKDAGKIGQVFTVGLGTPQSMKPYLADGSSSAAILWDVENLGYLTAWTGAQLAEGNTIAADQRRQHQAARRDVRRRHQDAAARPGTGHHQGQRGPVQLLS